MIFSVQRFLEDHFVATRRTDGDQYAIALANLYDRRRGVATKDEFLAQMRKLRTGFFRANRLDREDYEQQLLLRLDRRFKKKIVASLEALADFTDGLHAERRVYARARRRSIRVIVDLYRHGIESRGIDAFWRSRKSRKLMPNAENIAQLALTQLAEGVIQRRGRILKELASGIGYVDVGILLSPILHIIELKVLKSGHLVGPAQLDQYLVQEMRHEGWLIVLDARPPHLKTVFPPKILLPKGRVAHVIAVDINPPVPSKS